jgi:hypothetical protein
MASSSKSMGLRTNRNLYLRILNSYHIQLLFFNIFKRVIGGGKKRSTGLRFPAESPLLRELRGLPVRDRCGR